MRVEDIPGRSREKAIQDVLHILNNLPEGCMPSEICATALNLIGAKKQVICQIQVLPTVVCETVKGI